MRAEVERRREWDREKQMGENTWKERGEKATERERECCRPGRA